MSLIKYKTYTDDDFDAWKLFHDRAYGKNHILTDREHLNWYLGNWGHKTITAWDKNSMVGVYGAIPAKLRVKNKHYSFCWFVSGMVLPKYRGQGIGKTFVRKLLEVFDICGVIGFNPGVRRNYERFGFKQFDYKTLHRYVIATNPSVYKIIKPGYENKLRTILKNLVLVDYDNSNLTMLSSFKNGSYMNDIENNHLVNIVRDEEFLNWRYFKNPRILYEVTGYFENNTLKAYIVSRHELFYPTGIYATRIIDVAGSTMLVSSLLKHEIYKAQLRNDAFIDFSFTGFFYSSVLKQNGFVELVDDFYGVLPLVSSPVEYRENEEFICLGSEKYSDLFDDVVFNDLYFTRGDADRDRANYRRKDVRL